MRDVAPPGCVSLDGDRVAEEGRLCLEPELADALRADLALLSTLRVDRVLEAVHRDLPERRRDRVFDPPRQQIETPPRVVLVREQELERECLPEHRRSLRG